MGHEQHGCAKLLPDPEQRFLHHGARLRVERAERLVHQQDIGGIGESARDADALLHSSGQGLRVIAGECIEADHAHKVARRALRFLAATSRNTRSVSDIFKDGFPGKQSGLLEHNAAVGSGFAYLDAIDAYRAAMRREESGDGVEHRRFAATGGAEQAEELARCDIDADVIDRQSARLVLTECNDQIIDLDVAARCLRQMWSLNPVADRP